MDLTLSGQGSTFEKYQEVGFDLTTNISSGALANISFTSDLPVNGIGSQVNIARPCRSAAINVDAVEELNNTKRRQHCDKLPRVQLNASAQPVFETNEKAVVRSGLTSTTSQCFNA